jgi:hypothetical protein
MFIGPIVLLVVVPALMTLFLDGTSPTASATAPEPTQPSGQAGV